MQSVQKPIRESVTITLIPEEQELLLASLESFQHLDTSLYQDQVLDHLEGLKALHKKLQFLFPNESGDLCRSPDQSPDAVGQGGINFDTPWICSRCASTAGVSFSKFNSCSECFGVAALVGNL